jgi:hypothetical protein
MFEVRHNLLCAAVAAVGALGASQAGATPAVPTSQLDCPIVSGAACASSPGSYGSLTFTNDGTNTVDIGVNVSGSGGSIQYIALNYNETKFNSNSVFTATIGGNSVTVGNSENGESLNGTGNYAGLFDLLIPPTGTITQAGSNFTIALTATGLTAADLVGFTDTLGNFDAAVHLQDCGPASGTCQPGQTGSNSLVVGELVPAPAIGHGLLVLLAVGGVLFGGKLVESLKRGHLRAA